MTKIKITQVKSGIDRPERQKLTLRALGLTKMNASREVEATAQILGMIRKVNHLVRIEETNNEVTSTNSAEEFVATKPIGSEIVTQPPAIHSVTPESVSPSQDVVEHQNLLIGAKPAEHLEKDNSMSQDKPAGENQSVTKDELIAPDEPGTDLIQAS